MKPTRQTRQTPQLPQPLTSLKQDYIDRPDGHDEASGVFQVLDGGVLMLVRPSSGDHTFYKVKDATSIVMTDSLGNEPEGEMAKLYVLKVKKG